MQKEASVSPHSPAHSIAALNQDELTQERTAIVALLGNYRRLRERFVEAMEVQYRDFLVQRAISMMKANKWIAVLFYLFIGLLTYQQVRYVSTFASLEHELSLWIIIYIGGALVFSSIAVCVSNAKLDRYYSWYISIPSFIGLTGINIIASSFDSAYINQQASYVAIFIYMLMYSLGSLRLMHAFLVGGFASLLALAVIITFKLPVEFGQYAQYAGLSNLMGGLIASMIDQRDRRGFLQSRLIEIEKQQLNQLSSKQMLASCG